MRNLHPLLLAGGLVTLALLPGAASAQETAAPSIPSNSFLHQLDAGTTAIFDQIAPAVVVIDTEKKGDDPQDAASQFDFFFRNPDADENPRGQQAPRAGEGSGFILRADGYILTNNHVIEDGDKITVRLKDGRKFPAKLIGADPQSDIAVVKIDAANLPTAPLADSDKVRVGQLVCAIGVPFQLDWSFSVGWVSAKGRSGLTNTSYEDYLQTDAFINPGSSGGPLIDVDGRVVGMNTLVRGLGMGLAFAIPSNMLRDVGDQLIAHGKVVRPWLGLKIETLGENPALGQMMQGVDHGVVVRSIVADTPAYKSDLRPADVITQVDGVPLNTAKDLQREILKKKVGASVELTVWRKGETKKIAVQTEKVPDDVQRVVNRPAEDQKPETDQEDSLHGLKVRDLKPGERGKSAAGVVVESVDPDSPAAIADIKADDIITEVDQKPVKNAAGFAETVKSADLRKGILLFLDRDGQKTYGVLKQD